MQVDGRMPRRTLGLAMIGLAIPSLTPARDARPVRHLSLHPPHLPGAA